MGEHFAGESPDETRKREEEAAKREQEAKAAAQKAEAEKNARQAEAAKKITEGEFTGPELLTEGLVDGGGQISIDRESYHRFIDDGVTEKWFGKKAAEYCSERGISFFDAIDEAQTAAKKFESLPQDVRDKFLATGQIDAGDMEKRDLELLEGLGYFSQPDFYALAPQSEFLGSTNDAEERSRRIHAKADFLRMPYEQRKAFLASGNIRDLTPGMSEEEVAGVRKNLEYLRDSGFFAMRTESFVTNNSWQLPGEDERHDMVAAVQRADDALNAFNDCSADARSQFLASGDVSILAEDARKRVIEREKAAGKSDEEAAATGEKIAAATTEEMQFLQQEGFFAKKDQAEGAPDYPAVIDADFRSREATAENVSTVDLAERSRGWFDKKPAAERVDIIWQQNGGDEKLLDSLPDRDKELLERATSDADRARILERAKKDWYDSLPQDKRDQMIGEYLDDYKKSTEVWNGIPEEKRRAYLKSGKVEELAVMVEDGKDFDPNSEEGAQLVFCLEHLREMGVVDFGVDPEAKQKTADNWREQYDLSRGMEDFIRDNEAGAEADERREQSIVSYMDTINPDTGEKYTREEAEAAIKKEEDAEKRRKMMEEMRDAKIKSGDLIYSDKEHTQVRPEVQRILDDQAEDEPKLTLEEAALLAQLHGDERVYQKRLFIMSKRQEAEEQARAEGKPVNLSGVVDDFEGQHDKLYGAYTINEKGERIFAAATDADGNERKNASFFRTEEEARKRAEEIGGEVSVLDRSEEALGVDYETDSREDAIKKLKLSYVRRVGEPQEAYDARITKIYEAGLKGFESDKVRAKAKEWIDDDESGFRRFLLSKGDIDVGNGNERSVLDLVETTMDGEEIEKLMDEYRPIKNRDRMTRMMRDNPDRVVDLLEGEAPDLGRSLDSLSDDEIQEYLDRIDKGQKERSDFIAAVMCGDESNQFRKFVLRNNIELQNADEAKRAELLEKMPYSEMADLMAAFKETTEGKLVAVSADVSGDLDKVSRDLSAAMYEAEIARREEGWGVVGKLRSSIYKWRHDEESYVDLARHYIETGEKGRGGVMRHYRGEGAKSLAEYRSRYWERVNRTMDFELLARGEGDGALGEGESMSTFIPKKNPDSGEWSIFEKTETGEKAASGPRAEASAALMKAIEAFATSDGGRAARAAFAEEVERINATLGEGDKLKQENFFAIAQEAREKIDYGVSIENLDLSIVFAVRNSGGAGYAQERGETKTVHRELIDKLVSRHDREPVQTERIPRAKSDSATGVVGELRTAFEEIGKLPATDRGSKYVETVLPLIAKAKIYEKAGLMSGDEREMRALHDAMDAAYSYGGNPDGTRAATEQLEKAPTDAMLAKMAEGYSAHQLRITVSEERLDQLSHGNGAYVDEAIRTWNQMPKERRFGELMGFHSTPEGLLLRELGILRGGGEVTTEVEVKGRKTTVGKTETFPNYGLLPNSIETNIDVTDGQLRTVMNESEAESSIDELRHAIEVWNAAPDHLRRLVLIGANDMGFDQYELPSELMEAADKLDGVFFARSKDYRKTRVDISTRAVSNDIWSKLIDAGDWKAPGTDDPLQPEDIHNSQMIWNRTAPSVRSRLIAGETTNLDGTAIPDEVIRAYDVLDEAHLVGDFMTEDDGESPYERGFAELNRWSTMLPAMREAAFADDKADTEPTDRVRLSYLKTWRRIKELGISEDKARNLTFRRAA